MIAHKVLVSLSAKKGDFFPSSSRDAMNEPRFDRYKYPK